jgi:hypothetical protein
MANSYDDYDKPHHPNCPYTIYDTDNNSDGVECHCSELDRDDYDREMDSRIARMLDK